MSERKSINKYYPPDYDPVQAEKALKKSSKSLKTRQRDVVTIRLMTPFSMRCLECSEYIAQSRKFNGKKQLLPERYLDSIKVFRLSIRCPRCNHVICFRTDPKTADYVMESGGVRNYAKKSAGDARVETAEETLERLVRERKAAEHAALGGDGGDRQAALEQRLAQTQREQQGEQELERLLQAKRRRPRAPERSDGSEDSDAGSDGELERAAEAAFSRSAVASRTALPPAPAAPRKKPRKNPLGVVRRR